MLNKWYDDETYDKYLPDMNSTDFYFRVDRLLHKSFGIWAQYGGGFRKRGERIPFELNLFEDLDMNNFYILNPYKIDAHDDDIKYNSDTSNPGLSFGFMYRHESRKWSFMPYVGLGVNRVNSYQLKYNLKEKESNVFYNIEYKWFKDHDKKIKSMNFLYFHFKTERKISRKLGMSLGLAYKYYLTRSVFTASVYDHYDNTLIRTYSVNGNRISNLDINMSLSF